MKLWEMRKESGNLVRKILNVLYVTYYPLAESNKEFLGTELFFQRIIKTLRKNSNLGALYFSDKVYKTLLF